MSKEKLKPNWYIESIMASLLFLSLIISNIAKDTIGFTSAILSVVLILWFFILVLWILYKFLRNRIKK